MNVVRIDPIADMRWRRFIDAHDGSGIFHTPEWLDALRRTYDFIPFADVLLNADGEIEAGIPFCEIHSRITGRRIVSLPFSDHCEPLVRNEKDLEQLIVGPREQVDRRKFKYFELRPLMTNRPESEASAVVQRLDLSRPWSEIHKGFHKNHVIRRHSHAEKENLEYEVGRSEELILKFYHLLLMTRRKHQLPPQPLRWFRNLANCLGEKLTIRVLSKDGAPVATTLSLSFKKVRTYKYSCSNPKFNSIAGTVLLIWNTIEESLAEGATELDLGRSDLDNPGLVAFKDHWGAAKFPLVYLRYPESRGGELHESAMASFAKRLLVCVPDPMFSTLGGLFYRHAA